MKGFKINMDVVNCVLLVVILVLVIVCCVKREGFKGVAPPVNPGRVGKSQLSVGGKRGDYFDADASDAIGGPTLNSGGSATFFP
jgi:hypothetical protein